jgi:aldehyde dehydrogenase (NAD(P)+)
METQLLDRQLAVLQGHKRGWARLPIDDKIDYLDRLKVRTSRVASAWVAAAAKAKGLDPDSPLVGEEWMSGPYSLIYGITALAETLRRLDAGTDVLEGFKVSTRADGQVVVRVFPSSLQDRVLLSGLTADVWMQPGVTEANLRDTIAAFYQEPAPEGEVGLILGAGNISAIPVLDLLSELFIDGAVALVKMNPVNEYLGEFFEDIFQPLVDAGYVRFAYGAGDVGAYLTQHDDVDSIHITGAARTHDAIVYGRGEKGAARRENDEPILEKPITSELGGVGPTMVVPGAWSDADVRFQAEHIVSQKLHNQGFNCIASQVLVLPEGWEHADALLDAIRAVVREVGNRVAYYPGSADRHRDITDAYPDAERLTDGDVPVTLIPHVPADATGDLCFRDEFFGPVLAVTRLPGDDAAAFLEAATRFANTLLSGTLGANIIIDPATARANRESLDRAVADLRYGTVAVNTWTGVGFLLARATWGAFPGHTHGDIQSGVGVVHNALMFGRPERTVLHGPFAPAPRSAGKREWHMAPKPPFFVTNKQAAVVGERLTTYSADESWKHFPGIIAAALRG